MRPTGDDLRGMGATGQIHDDVIDAVVRGDAVHGVHAPLAAFARQVRALGDEPVPAPSGELAALLGGSPRPRRALRAVGAPVPAGTADRSERKSMSDVSRLAGMTGKVAGLGLAAKFGLAASLAAASIGGAGAAGVLPAAANHAVRAAIEVVTPVDFGERHQDTTNFGDRVSDDATGASDGVPGVDGRQIADEAPGADHRSDSAVPGEPPGQSGDTGLTRANETPAAPHAPDVPPTTVPPGGGADDSQGGTHAPGSVPSTVPDHGLPAVGDGGPANETAGG